MKIALVTGGSRGLGKNIGGHLARNGYGVIVTYHRSRAEAQSVVQTIEQEGGIAAALHLDVADTVSQDRFCSELVGVLNDRWGALAKLDLLVNNAGFGLHKPFEETTEAEFDALMNTHLKGPFFLIQRLLPLMNDGGRILNLSSGLARFSLPGYSAYAAMKGGIEVLTRYLALELGPRAITVNVIAPGAVETDFGGGAVRDNPDVNAFIASQTALSRAGLPDDIGAAVTAIVSDACHWINGQRIEISGGMRL